MIFAGRLSLGLLADCLRFMSAFVGFYGLLISWIIGGFAGVSPVFCFDIYEGKWYNRIYIVIGSFLESFFFFFAAFV